MAKKTLICILAIIFSFVIAILSTVASPVLPNLIALSSPDGTKLFNQSYSPEYFWPLVLQFVTQQNLNYCSIASSVTVLNALDIPAPGDPLYLPFKTFTQNNFFTAQVEKILPAKQVAKQGATLEQLSHALATYPIFVQIFHADQMTMDQFRELTKKTIETQNGYIIVNFLRTKIGENGYGHMSPLAGYDENSDRFLVLDVARYRYPSVWVKTKDLWDGMNTIDKDAKAYRGFIIVSKIAKHTPQSLNNK